MTPQALIAKARKLDKNATPPSHWYRGVAADSAADARFIVRARTLVPELADALEKALAHEARLREALEAYAGHHQSCSDHHRDDCPGDCRPCEIDDMVCSALRETHFVHPKGSDDE